MAPSTLKLSDMMPAIAKVHNVSEWDHICQELAVLSAALLASVGYAVMWSLTQTEPISEAFSCWIRRTSMSKLTWEQDLARFVCALKCFWDVVWLHIPACIGASVLEHAQRGVRWQHDTYQF